MSFPNPFYRWRPYALHGLEIGPRPPQFVHVFIEQINDRQHAIRIVNAARDDYGEKFSTDE